MLYIELQMQVDGFFYYFISEFCVLLTLRCGDCESSLIQNGGLSVACCSNSHCVLLILIVYSDRAGREYSPPSFITRLVSVSSDLVGR